MRGGLQRVPDKGQHGLQWLGVCINPGMSLRLEHQMTGLAEDRLQGGAQRPSSAGKEDAHLAMASRGW